MSIVSRILVENPDAFYLLSGAAPYVDLSRRRLANTSPTVTRVPVSPARGIAETVNLAAATTLTLHKAPAGEFTLLTQSKPLTTSSTNLLSFYGADQEGIWQFGNTINFGVRHLGGTFTTVSAEIDGSRIHIIGGVAQKEKITIYCDGVELVSKTIIDPAVFDNDATLTLADPNAALYSFAAAWMRAVSGTAMAAIAAAGNPAPLRTYALSQLFSADLRLDSLSSDLEDFEFSEYYSFLPNLATVAGTTIRASYDTSLVSVAGNVRFPLPFVSTTTGIRLSWGASNGAVVKYSLDGVSFTTAYNGQTVEAGTTITNQPIIEVSFPAASTSDMYLSDFRAERQVSGILLPSLSNGRVVTMNGSVSLAANSDFRKYPSLPSTFGTNGTLTISPETEDPSLNTYAVEFWYTPVASDLTGSKGILDSNPQHASSIYVISNKLNWSGFSTVYVNKVATAINTYTVVPGVPMHVVAVYTTQNNAQIRFGLSVNPVAGNISNIGLIYQAPSAGDVTALFDNQQDVPVTRPTSNSTIAVTDTGVSNLGLVWTAGSQ